MTDTDVALLSVVVRVGLLACTLLLVRLAVQARMPWAMVISLVAAVTMASALIIAGLRPGGLEYLSATTTRQVTLTLSFVSIVLMAASAWSMWGLRRRH